MGALEIYCLRSSIHVLPRPNLLTLIPRPQISNQIATTVRCSMHQLVVAIDSALVNKLVPWCAQLLSSALEVLRLRLIKILVNPKSGLTVVQVGNQMFFEKSFPREQHIFQKLHDSKLVNIHVCNNVLSQTVRLRKDR